MAYAYSCMQLAFLLDLCWTEQMGAACGKDSQPPPEAEVSGGAAESAPAPEGATASATAAPNAAPVPAAAPVLAAAPAPAAASGGSNNTETPHCGSGKALQTEYFTCREVPEAEGDEEAAIAYPAFGQAFPDKEDQDLFPPVQWSNVPVVDALAGVSHANPST